MSDPLHAMDPTGRFSDRAADYARHRPAYPPAALDALLEGLGNPALLVAADVGAGTGISARALADRGPRVFAVEPNRAMREAAAPHPRVTWVDATAERTGLADAGVDVVLCAQSFHWFEPAATLAEFLRILRPGGRVGLLWNERDPTEPESAEYSRLLVEAAGHHPASSRHVRPEPLLASNRFRDVRRLEFPHAQVLDEEGLVGRALSASYAPKSGPAHEGLVRGLRALFARFTGPAGTVRIAYRTSLYLAEAPRPTG